MAEITFTRKQWEALKAANPDRRADLEAVEAYADTWDGELTWPTHVWVALSDRRLAGIQMEKRHNQPLAA